MLQMIAASILLLLTSLHAYALDINGALDGERYRILISSDIGGSDPDDFQSMIHFMIYSDLFDTEGIIASPWDTGRKEHILQVINQYEIDYPKLKTHSKRFPTPDDLRSISKQGAVDIAPDKGYREPTEGSDWIIQCAKNDDPRPLYVLVWGLIEDVAQALHDAPEIEEKIRVIYIGGPNKKWGANAFDYIEQNHPNVWMIENNSTYRGFFVGDKQDDGYGNHSFYEQHLKGHGALGGFFGNFKDGEIKMGDTPTLVYMMTGNPQNPESDSWGGRFQKVIHCPKFAFNSDKLIDNRVEVFSIVEWTFNVQEKHKASDEPVFFVHMNEQIYHGYSIGDGQYRFRFAPKNTGEHTFKIESKIDELDGLEGRFISVPEGTLNTAPGAVEHENWWTDLYDPSAKEGPHCGAKTVNQWRVDILNDWRKRMEWLK